jgi:hypothetical protein
MRRLKQLEDEDEEVVRRPVVGPAMDWLQFRSRPALDRRTWRFRYDKRNHEADYSQPAAETVVIFLLRANNLKRDVWRKSQALASINGNCERVRVAVSRLCQRPSA